MSAHSHGPWTAHAVGHATLAIREPSGARVAVVIADHNTAEADARLIASAPALFALVERYAGSFLGLEVGVQDADAPLTLEQRLRLDAFALLAYITSP